VALSQISAHKSSPLSTETFLKHIQSIEPFITVLNALTAQGIPNAWLAGGALTQSYWNHQQGLPWHQGVKDFDVVYFAQESIEAQRQREQQLNATCPVAFDIDLKNQALVHTWYGQKFGHEIDPYESALEGIESWIPAFSVGIALAATSQLKLYAPFSLADIYHQRVTPNKKVMSRQSYETLCEGYRRRWPFTVATW